MTKWPKQNLKREVSVKGQHQINKEGLLEGGVRKRRGYNRVEL